MKEPTIREIIEDFLLFFSSIVLVVGFIGVIVALFVPDDNVVIDENYCSNRAKETYYLVDECYPIVNPQENTLFLRCSLSRLFKHSICISKLWITCG